MAKSSKASKQKTQKVTASDSIPLLTSKSEFNLEDKICIGLLACLIMIIYVIRTKFSQIPFERDEGIYSYFGKLILEGKVPYKDFFEIKFPGLFYFYALIVKVFGDTVKAMHIGFMYLNLLTTIIIYIASRNLFSPIAGIISAITFAFVSLTAGLSGFTIQSEHAVAFFISLGILFYSMARKTPKWYWYGLMGFSMGCSFMIKTNGVFLCLWGGVILIIDFIFTKPMDFKKSATNIVAYAIGGFSILLLFILIMYTKGVLNEMIYYTIEVPKKYIGGVTLEQGLEFFNQTKSNIIENHKFFWIHSIFSVVICFAKPINFRLKLLGITLLIFSFLTFVPGFYFYGHYWIQSIPGLAIVSGLTYYSIITIRDYYLKDKYSFLPYAYLGIFLLFTYTHINSLKSYYFRPNYDTILRSVYGSNPFPEAMEIGKFINANSKPEDNIVLIGSEPQIYFYTKKMCPSRFAYFTALVNNTPEHRDMQKEFIGDVERVKPRYFVFFNHPISLLVQQGADTNIFNWANNYINKHYKLVGLIDMVNGSRSIYKWFDEAQSYKPASQMVIYIFELK